MSFSSIVNDLPPTPSKFHYIFNLRDLSRIYHGMCLTTPDRFSKVENFIRVWRNECLRVIGDRLINDTDKEIVNVSPLVTLPDRLLNTRIIFLHLSVIGYCLLILSVIVFTQARFCSVCNQILKWFQYLKLIHSSCWTSPQDFQV